MQQRRLRLGDILDDYCPRERRITNHAVVAMIDDTVKQTRCTTCEAEHEYKEAKIPPQRRRKDAPGSLVAEVLEGAPKGVIRKGETDEEPLSASFEPGENDLAELPRSEPSAADAESLPSTLEASNGNGTSGEVAEPEVEGPLHRRLIRATLPRPDGQVPARPTTDFTLRHAPNHPAGFQANGAARPARRRPGGRGPGGGGGQGQHRVGAGSRPGVPAHRQPGRSTNQRPGQPRHARPAGGHSSRPGKRRK